MNQSSRRLGDAELEIMLAIWSADGPVPSTYVHEKLRPSRSWALPAVITSLNRLVEKSFLACEKQGRSNLYRPLISERDYKASESRSFLDRLYGSSFQGLVASLYDSRAIGVEDLEQLRDFLAELEEERHG